MPLGLHFQRHHRKDPTQQVLARDWDEQATQRFHNLPAEPKLVKFLEVLSGITCVILKLRQFKDHVLGKLQSLAGYGPKQDTPRPTRQPGLSCAPSRIVSPIPGPKWDPTSSCRQINSHQTKPKSSMQHNHLRYAVEFATMAVQKSARSSLSQSNVGCQNRHAE